MNNRYSNSCGCEQPGMAPVSAAGSSKSLAMAYVPWQKWQNVMDLIEFDNNVKNPL